MKHDHLPGGCAICQGILEPQALFGGAGGAIGLTAIRVQPKQVHKAIAQSCLVVQLATCARHVRQVRCDVAVGTGGACCIAARARAASVAIPTILAPVMVSRNGPEVVDTIWGACSVCTLVWIHVLLIVLVVLIDCGGKSRVVIAVSKGEHIIHSPFGNHAGHTRFCRPRPTIITEGCNPESPAAVQADQQAQHHSSEWGVHCQTPDGCSGHYCVRISNAYSGVGSHAWRSCLIGIKAAVKTSVQLEPKGSPRGA